MKHALAATAGLVLVCGASAVFAQAPAAAPAPGPGSDNPLISKAPHYVSIHMEVDVNKPAADVWKRVGKYCDLGEWLRVAAGCTITSGKDGEFGAVRTIGNEVLVGMTPLSYTYTQGVANAARTNQPYNLYHGTLEARPVTATTSKLIYTLFFDNSMLADDAARARDIETRTTRFTAALNNAKLLAEGGTLPPLPPPAPRGGAAAPAAGPAPGR